MLSIIDVNVLGCDFLTSYAQVGEWGGGDCGPVLVGGDGGSLTVITLLRQ